jgi:dTDP-4-dehydrorhamnose reductase
LKVWVTGAGGLIGNWFCHTAPVDAGVFSIGLRRQDLDLTDPGEVRARFYRDLPDVVIHCAALSRSPECEASPALARRVNVEATKLLSELCADRQLVFFSTDLVFDGKKGNYVETDPVSPLSVYAKTKVEAENVVQENPRHLVVRTSLNGGSSPTGDRGFNEQICNAWREGKTLSLFTDEFRSPIAAEMTTRAVWELALGGYAGVYHIAGSERLSRYEIGFLLAQRWPELKPRFRASSLKEYQGAPRAPDTSLDCSKAQGMLGFELPAFTKWLEQQPRGSF